MLKQKMALALGISLLVVSQTGLARQSFYDTAKVVSVKPIYETVQVVHPEERCWNERVYHRTGPRKSHTPALAGAIIGGAVGNQFGKGHGKDALTVAGALLGASIGNDISRTNRGGYATTERRCEIVEHYEDQEEIVGYRVKYRYKGEVFGTRTRHHPGKHIRVRVSVNPAE